MRHLKTEGFIIRSQNYKESDKLLTLLTLEKGKVSAIARGACKTKSKLAASVELFTLGDYVLYMGKSLATVTQGEIKDSQRALRGDLVRYAYGQYICELLIRILEEKEPFPDVYNLILSAFRALNESIDYDVLVRSFELKLLDLLGYRPYLDECLVCSKESSNYSLSFSQGGIICCECNYSDSSSKKIPLGTLSLLRKLLSSDFSRLKVLKIDSFQKKEILFVNKKLLDYNVNLGPCKSLMFLEQLGNYK